MRLHTCAQVAPQLLLQECYGAMVGEGTVCAEEDLASPGDCDLIIGSLLLESTSFSCSSAGNESAVWQGMGATLPCTALPPAHPLRPGVAQPLVFCFLFHPLFHITLFFFLCFLSHLTCPGATQFTDGRYWIYSPRQRRLRTTSRSSGIVSDHTSTARRGAELQL